MIVHIVTAIIEEEGGDKIPGSEILGAWTKRPKAEEARDRWNAANEGCPGTRYAVIDDVMVDS